MQKDYSDAVVSAVKAPIVNAFVSVRAWNQELDLYKKKLRSTHFDMCTAECLTEIIDA